MPPQNPTLSSLVAASGSVAATRSRLAKIEALAIFFGDVPTHELPTAIAFLSGSPRQAKLGVGWAAIRNLDVAPAAAPILSLTDVEEMFQQLEATSGKGSTRRRADLLDSFFARATHEEQDFLRRLIMRDLRQGATEGLMVEALARSADVPPGTMRRGAMLAGSIVTAGVIALTDGEPGVRRIGLQLFRPVAPMLASTAESVDDGIESFGTASVEAKLDGARIQVHKQGEKIAVYTRNLNEITDRVPEIVRAVAELPVQEVILDGEAMSFRPDGQPHPFQVTMGRFGTEIDVAGAERTLPVVPVFFDVLLVDQRELLDEPLQARHDVLDRLPESQRVARLLASDPADAHAFLDAVLAAGHEGVMVKDPQSSYAAGRRGKAWLKVKPAHTLDLVVLAVEWGSGRRQGWLSNLHLGARDPSGGFVMLGKTFKGMTDEMLEWQTKRFLQLETDRQGHVVHVQPEQVVEIAFDGVQASSRYPGGMALRFARVKQYRDDKPASEANTVDEVWTIFEHARQRAPAPPSEEDAE